MLSFLLRKFNKRLLSASLFAVFVVCARMPTEIDNGPFGDCKKPTIPKEFKKNSAEMYGVLEIYDYEKRLIYFRESIIDVDSPWSAGFNPNKPIAIYWNGYDSDGKKADNGKYLAKISIISRDDKSCQCTELFVND